MEVPTYLTPALSILSAAIYGSVAQFIRLGLRHLDSQRGSAISILTTLSWFVLMSPWWFRPGDWLNPGLLAFAVAGLVHRC